MSRSRRLQPLAEVAARHAEDGARAVARARAQLAAEEARLEELAGYRRQYDAMPATEGAAHPFSLANRHAFGAQLDEALRLQQQRVGAAQVELERVVEEWTGLRRHERAMERLVGRCAGEEQRESDRAEQRGVDDASSARRGNVDHSD